MVCVKCKLPQYGGGDAWRWDSIRKEDTFFFSFLKHYLKIFPQAGEINRRVEAEGQPGRCWVGESESSVPQALFHASLTLKVMALQFFLGKCTITLAMREKNEVWVLRRNAHEKPLLRDFTPFSQFLTCTVGNVLADTLPQTWHNPTTNSRGNILHTIMKPTVLGWKWVLSWLLAQVVCHHMQQSLWSPQITPLPWLIHPHLFCHMDCCSQVCQYYTQYWV